MKDIKKIKNFLLDMDGTIYVGERLFECTPRFLAKIREIGGRAVFVTNNSSKGQDAYLEKLARLGIDAAPEDIFTSGDAAAITIAERYARPRVYLMGTPSLEKQFRDYGIELLPFGAGRPDCAVLGFDLTLTYDKIRDACALIRDGVKFIATHPDRLCPAEGGSIPDVGSMIKMFAEATGVEPEIMGKPEKSMAKALFSRYGFLPEETAMVGDRLNTDIKFGNNAGIASVLVLSGETTAADLESSPCAVPDFVFPSVGELADAIS